MVVNYSRMHATPIGQAIRDSGISFFFLQLQPAWGWGWGWGGLLWYFRRKKETRETGQSSLPAV